LWEIAGALVGALIGAKLLAIADSWDAWRAAAVAATGPASLEKWLGGKTIVGGLIGGWIGVEIAKKLVGNRERTGDLWVYPLTISIAIGRVGCFLTGLTDQTYGTHTTLPWGVDFGDGPRHPTQLYEIGVLLLIVCFLLVYQRATRYEFGRGVLFRWFMLLYCGWRFLSEFIKPTAKPFGGISAIQVACLIACGVAGWSLMRGHHELIDGAPGRVNVKRR
jgi:prolipoprotein diacylglyceryltransferase